MTDHAQHYADIEDVPEDERFHVRHIPLSKLHSSRRRNPNSMSEPEYARLKLGIDELGFVQNLVVVPRDDGEFEVADGEHRRRALEESGWSYAPCYVVETWDEAQQIIARLALNQNRGQLDLTTVAEDITYLADTLNVELDELVCTGFDESQIDDMLTAMRDDINAVTPKDIAGTSVTERASALAEKPTAFGLEFKFTSKADRDRVRAACKLAGNGNINTGLLTLVGQGDGSGN
jgi:ParB-like chromosome segregation protein Spo0J